MSSPVNSATVVSIIVPTFNSGIVLGSCLRSVARQVHPSWEVLVIDNYSNDSTRRVAESFGAKVILYRGTQAGARNIGLNFAKGRFVLFLDSDQQLEDGVITECLNLCLSNGFDALKIPEVFIGLDFWGKCSAFWKNHVTKVSGVKGGFSRFFSKDIIVRFSGFHANLRYWEDRELSLRLKVGGVREGWCRSRVFHFENGSLRSITGKYLSYGRSIGAFGDYDENPPFFQTVSETLSTVFEVLRGPGRSFKVFFGFIFLFVLKGASMLLGFLLNLHFQSNSSKGSRGLASS